MANWSKSLCGAALWSAVILAPASGQATSAAQSRAARWWADVVAIADDRNAGREAGSAGYLRAAAYVERRLRQIGVVPAGEHGGFRQDVALEEQRIDFAGSTAALIDPAGQATPVRVGEDMLVIDAGGRSPAAVDAEMVFIGYGLHLPAEGHDDLAGVDLRGKIAVAIAGGPADIGGPVKASNRAERVAFLARAGAIGLITLSPPKQMDIPWKRQITIFGQPGMYLADPALRDVPDGFLLGGFDPAQGERLFAGSGHSFAEVAAASDRSAPIAGFVLKQRLRAAVKTTHRRLTSPNIVARLPGADPTLADQYVVVSAHLDHVGVGPAVNGDRIYNGAMDDASGVAAVLDLAARLKAGPRPRRSILFLIVTAEETGLLGSEYFARRPTVPGATFVADLNFDMPLPLWPLTQVLALGDRESTLGDHARAVAARQGLELIDDPTPNRNSFIRTDQYSFVRAGVPSLAFKFGAPAGSEAARIQAAWIASRYHAPSDDSAQPGILREEAIKLDDYVAALAIAIANDPTPPRWLATSPFGKFARRR